MVDRMSGYSINDEFRLSPTQLKRFEEWKAPLKKYMVGPIGGAFTFHFTPTSIGTIVRVTCESGKFHDELDLTENM
jgi:hypothetical protein